MVAGLGPAAWSWKAPASGRGQGSKKQRCLLSHFKTFTSLCRNSSYCPQALHETQFTLQPVSVVREALRNGPEFTPEAGSQRKHSFVSKEEGVLEFKDFRRRGGYEHSPGRIRKAGSGTGLPVALEWNAHYSYLDINGWDPRRLENMWYFKNTVRQGSLQ